jgi:hypothetical protein
MQPTAATTRTLSASPGESQHLGFAVICLLAALLLSVIVFTESAWTQASAPLLRYVGLSLLLVLIAVAGISWGSVSLRLGRLDLLELPVWYSLWALLSIVFFGLFGYLGDPRKYGTTRVVPEPGWAADGLWLLVVSLPSLWIGYRLGWMRLTKQTRPVWWQNTSRLLPSRLVLAGVYLLIWLLRMWQVRAIGIAYDFDMEDKASYSAFIQWATYFQECSYLVVAVLAMHSFRRELNRAFLWIVVALEIVFGLTTGFVAPVFRLFVLLLGVAMYCGRRLWTRQNAFIAFLLLATYVFVAPVTSVYRDLVRTGIVNPRSVFSAAAGAAEATRLSWGTDLELTYELLESKVVGRQAGFAPILGVIVNVTPADIPFWGVDRLLLIPLSIVPRAIWPDKPVLTLGHYFNVEYLGASPDSTTSVNYTMYGDLYLSAGWPAVVIGMMLLGVILAWLYRGLALHAQLTQNPGLFALYTAIAVSMIFDETAYVGLVSGLFHHLVIFPAVFVLIYAPSRNQMHGQDAPAGQRNPVPGTLAE